MYLSVCVSAASETLGTAVLTARNHPRGAKISVAYESPDGDDVEKASGTEAKKPRWEPKNWKQQLTHIREMRKERDAPVDHMGAGKCFDSDAPPQVRQKAKVKSERSI